MGYFDKFKDLGKRPTNSSANLNAFIKSMDKSPTEVRRHTHLYTNGGEFSLVKPISTNLAYEYIGSYHIHPNKGPMEGSTHKDEPHRILIPLTEDAANIIRTKLGWDCYPNNDYSKFVPLSNNTNQGGGTY